MPEEKPLKDTRNLFTSKSITLGPGKGTQLALGSYSKSDPTPRFNLLINPDVGDDVGSSLERLDLPGSGRYVMFYHLHNFGSIICTVTAERREDDSND